MEYIYTTQLNINFSSTLHTLAARQDQTLYSGQHQIVAAIIGHPPPPGVRYSFAPFAEKKRSTTFGPVVSSGLKLYHLWASPNTSAKSGRYCREVCGRPAQSVCRWMNIRFELFKSLVSKLIQNALQG